MKGSLILRGLRRTLRRMPSSIEKADAGLLPDNFRPLNNRFYEAKPWVYFDRRLSHLALVVGAPDRYHAAFSEPIEIGPVTFQEHTNEGAGEDGLDDQNVAAAEAEVLLHHAAETLLRLCDAHAPGDDGEPPPCPWLSITRRRSPREFKRWVATHIRGAADSDLHRLIQGLFGPARDDEDVRRHAQFLRLYARHFLEPDPYNAAKHGFAVQGGHSRLTLTVEEEELLRDEGLTVEWLAVSAVTGRWVRVERWFSVEAVIALIHIASRLVESLWLSARDTHLDERATRRFYPPVLDELLRACDIADPVLLETEHDLAYDGCGRDIRFRKRVRRRGPGETS
jgi:hypothetical protein